MKNEAKLQRICLEKLTKRKTERKTNIYGGSRLCDTNGSSKRIKNDIKQEYNITQLPLWLEISVLLLMFNFITIY